MSPINESGRKRSAKRNISLTELFDVEELQKLQDQFSLSANIASVLVDLSGVPITRASGFTKLCQMIRKTSRGMENCCRSDAVLGKRAKDKPVVLPCLSAGLWDAATSIKIQGEPVAFWMIGQIRHEGITEEDIRRYAREIGSDEEQTAEAFHEVPSMTKEKFEHTVELLSILANQLSTIAYQNYTLNRHVQEDKKLMEELKRSEAYLRTFMNTVPDLFWIKDREGRFLYANPREESFLGKKSEEIIGRTDYDFVDREQADIYLKRDREILEEKIPVKNEVELTFASDGHREILETIKTPIVESDGEISGILGIARDISAYKEAEKERLENIEFFRNLDRINQTIQKSTDLEEVFNNILDDVMDIFHCHRAYFVYPCDPDSPVLSSPFSRHSPDVPPRGHIAKEMPMSPYVSAAYRKMLDTGELYERYEPEKGNEGNWDKFKTRAIMQILLRPKVGKPWVFVLHHCLSERRWTDREKDLFQEIGRRITDSLTNLLLFRNIQEQENFITNIFENIPDMIFVKDAADLKFVRVNKAGEQLLGLDRKDMLDKSDYDFFPKEMADGFAAKDREALKGRVLVDIPREEIETAGQGKRVLHTQKIPMVSRNGEAEFLLGISEDITDRLAAERELEEKREWLQAFMESASVAITIFDSEGQVIQTNEQGMLLFPEMIGRDRVAGSKLSDWRKLLLEEGKNFFHYYDLVKDTGETYMYQDGVRRNGELLHYSHKIFPVGEGVGLISTDITEQKKLEGQIQQIQKVESIGRLAGGVAHDFNNILGIIMGYTEMAQNSSKKDEELDSYLQEIMNAAERSADLTRQLLAFARKQNAQPRPLNLNEAVKKMLKMLDTLIGEYIKLIWRGAEDLWVTSIDPAQIDQVLANLCVNARDAIGETGTISINTSNQTLDETYCAFHPDTTPGDYVCLTVSDDGKGMTKETVEKIFEPFFTTKGMGKGTGLGLSTVYGIVKQNRGSISVYSEEGIGTTFKVFFPRVTTAYTDYTEEQEKEISGGKEKILIIEDEKALMKMTARMLTNFGYRVLTAETKDEALEYTGEAGKDLDLILSDIVMPEMNGKEIVEHITGEHPRIKYLFMSGYTDDIIALHGILEAGIQFIQKPFSSQDLSSAIRRILDQD